MSEAIVKLFQKEGGEFVSSPSLFLKKLKRVRAILFDWDGVFNDGFKRGGEGSIFSEVDAMGTNMLRYALWKLTGSLPAVAIITGENNPSAQSFGQRESFHEVYYSSKNKVAVFASFCEKKRLKADEVLFFFDDVLDFEVARQCGARIMMGRRSNPMLIQYARQHSLTDYVTGLDGGHHGLREGCELVIGLLGMYDDVIMNRSIFSKDYESYLADRKKIQTELIAQKLS